ncbi:hypothetical protein BKA70DRAFT_1253384 [Coprinopsis sp. MPI-PUGE-AT-0042]|nr:hypothetical protein BKA70DRAFT_1253384 [Coprinopsis sp. MPI-PUGE-AT-0042]
MHCPMMFIPVCSGLFRSILASSGLPHERPSRCSPASFKLHGLYLVIDKRRSTLDSLYPRRLRFLFSRMPENPRSPHVAAAASSANVHQYAQGGISNTFPAARYVNNAPNTGTMHFGPSVHFAGMQAALPPQPLASGESPLPSPPLTGQAPVSNPIPSVPETEAPPSQPQSQASPPMPSAPDPQAVSFANVLVALLDFLNWIYVHL